MKRVATPIVPEEKCLTQDETLRYAQGIVSRDEAQRMDAHLNLCPFCSDAIDGFLLLPIGQAQKSLENIEIYGDKDLTVVHRQIDAVAAADETPVVALEVETPAKTVGSRLRFWAAAAATVVGLAGGGVMMLTRGEGAPPNLGDGTTAAETVANATENNGNNAPQTEFKLNEAEPAQPKYPSGGENMPPPSTKPSKDGKIPSAKPAEPANTPVVSGTASGTPDYKNPNQNADGITMSSAPAPNATTGRPLTESSGVAYDSDLAKENVSESRTYKNVPTSPRNSHTASKEAKASKLNVNPQTAFQQGMSFFKNKRYGDAIREYNAVLALETSGDLYEMALWYLAEAKNNYGSYAEARQIWQRIVNENGKFAQRAAEKLK